MAIQNRYEFMYYVAYVNCNPNGDPDMGNTPRVDPQTMQGYITDGDTHTSRLCPLCEHFQDNSPPCIRLLYAQPHLRQCIFPEKKYSFLSPPRNCPQRLAIIFCTFSNSSFDMIGTFALSQKNLSD